MNLSPRNLVKKTLSHSFIQDHRLMAITAFALILNIALWIFLVVTLKATSESIPLHYNVYFGEDYYGSTTEAYRLPLMGLMILIFNFILGLLFYAREKTLSYFLISFLPIVQAFLLIAIITIYLINR